MTFRDPHVFGAKMREIRTFNCVNPMAGGATPDPPLESLALGGVLAGTPGGLAPHPLGLVLLAELLPRSCHELPAVRLLAHVLVR